MKKYIYFDTNVINKLAYVNNYDFIFRRMKKFNHFVCISEVTIFEVLRDRTDQNNIDKIIIMLQSINSILIVLPSLNDIVTYFLLNKTIDIDFKKYNCKGVIKEVLNDPKRTFIIAKEYEVFLTDSYKEFCKLINKEIKKLFDNEECKNCRNYYCDIKIKEISLLFTSLFLINKFSLIAESDIDSCWKKLDIFNIDDKINYINSNTDWIIGDNSIFNNMARFAIIQKNNMNNGTFNDCLHLAYLNYVDFIVSDDKHFKNNIQRVLTLDEYLESINIKINWEDK